MWGVAELNEEYVRKLEDVLELYERPYNQAEPVVCLDEKPVSLRFIGMCDLLGTRRLPTLASLRVDARAWNATVNEARTKIDWQFSRKDARRKLGYNKYLSKRSPY